MESINTCAGAGTSPELHASWNAGTSMESDHELVGLVHAVVHAGELHAARVLVLVHVSQDGPTVSRPAG